MRRNAVDYILLVLVCLLLLSIGARYVMQYLHTREDNTCQARVSFVLRGIPREEAPLVSTLAAPFLFGDNGISLGVPTLIEEKPSMMVLEQNDGTLTSVPSETHVDLFFVTVRDGVRAKDGTFLLDGARRLAAGDRFTLLRAHGQYESEFLSVQIL